MHGVARNFFTLALLYAIGGMALGLHMSITHDHAQMPTHAHAMVAGWLMSAVFAFYYHLVPAAAHTRLAAFHFWLMAVSGLALMVGLYFLLAGNEAIEPIVAIGSMAFYAGMILFAGIALKTMWSAAETNVYPNGTQ
jgi:hypothetical protein